MSSIKLLKNKKFKLKQKQIDAIDLFINGKMKQNEVAKAVDVSDKTIYNWLYHDEEFRNAMEWYRKEKYKNHAPEAVTTVLEIMRTGNSDKVRLAAAKDILDRAGDNAISKVDFESENTFNINVRRIEKGD